MIRRASGRPVPAWWRWLTVPWTEATLALTLVAAAAVPAFLMASAGVWRQGAEDEITERAVEGASPDLNGVDIRHPVRLDPDTVPDAADELARAVGRVDGLEPPDVAIYTYSVQLSRGDPVQRVGPPGRLLVGSALSGSLELERQLDDLSGGVLVSTWFAERHGLELGDGIGVEVGDITRSEWDARHPAGTHHPGVDLRDPPHPWLGAGSGRGGGPEQLGGGGDMAGSLRV